MKVYAKGRRSGLLLAAFLLGVGCGMNGPAAADEDQELLDLLEDVGQAYAEGYLAPLTTGFGVNQLSGIYSTASIPKVGINFRIGVKFFASSLVDDDKTFRKVTRVTLDERFDILPSDPRYGERANMIMAGPTIFGSEDDIGTATVYYQGFPIYQAEAIEGLWETNWVPLFAPQVEVGGLIGLRATLRWLPEIEGPGDVGKIKFLGYGLSYSVSQLVPQPPAGLDFMIGLFRQTVDVGDFLEFSATSYYAAASRTFGVATVYAGVAVESASTDVTYTAVIDDFEQKVSFEQDGEQKSRFTLGGTLGLGPMQLNGEFSYGHLAAFSAGLMAGF